MIGEVYDGKINKHQDWGGDNSTNNLPVSGTRVQEFIKDSLNAKFGAIYYDQDNASYLLFADPESRDMYLADRINNANLLLGSFLGPSRCSVSVMLTIKDKKTKDVVADCDVAINAITKRTNASGVVAFALPTGTYNATFTHNNYKELLPIEVVVGTVDIIRDLEIAQLYDTDKTYMVFTVTDNQSIDLSSKMNGITNVNWGDGTVDANTSHVYTTAGDYDVIITHTEASSFSFIGTQFLKEIKSLGILSKVDWEDTFRYCVSLLRIHNTAFNNCIGVTVFRGCFNSCRSLASIPAGLFDKNVNVINFRDCFGNCNSLTTIPAGLFDKCVNVTDFSGCFINCGNLSSIPAGLFDNNDNVTDLSSCFNACNSLTTIPAGLFDKCVNVTDFRGCFFSCQSLTSIPAGLFDNCVNVIDFDSCFCNCTSLDQSYSLTSPDLPKLWERDGTNGAVAVTSFSSFAIGAPATFRATVPVEWGGTMVP